MVGEIETLNVKIVKLIDKLEVQTILKEIVKDLKEISVKFKENLIVEDMYDKEDNVQDLNDKEDIFPHSIKDMCKVSNDKEASVEHTNDMDNASMKDDTLDEPKSLAIQKSKRKSLSKLVICELCGKVFDKNCDLEHHIIKCHEDYQKFECEKCRKIFVTEWRLNKHRRIHKRKTKKYCYNFNAGKSCPFEELGCKFLHLFSDNHKKGSNIPLTDSLSSFFTSTPKKPFKDCEECMDSSECADCIAKHILGQRALAKLMFC